MIHIIGRIATVLGIIAFFYLFSRVIALGDVGQLLQIRHFTWSSFLLSVSLAASWQIAYGPYVADYSRYLPSRTSSFKTFLAVGLGSVLGAQIAMVLGVLAAAMAAGQFAGREVAYIVGLGGTGAMAALLYFTIAFGKVTISTLNSYGSFMCIATIASGFRGHVEISRRQRALLVLVIVAAATAVALIGQHSFLNAFKSFILFLLAFFVPWSAVNLVDYYFVSREQYDVEALSDPNGRYGRWNWPGILIYLFGVLVQMPFISTKLYTGPMVERLGGVDISWIIGLVVPSILYYLFARRDAVPQHRGAARATHTL
jgi:NCS1 family nucleobase:cation symporter-1